MLQHFAKHQRIMAKKRQENIKLHENVISPQQAPHNEHVTEAANKEQNSAEIEKNSPKLVEESSSQSHLKRIPLAPRRRRRRPFIDKFNKNWMVKPPKLDDKQKQTDQNQ